MNPKYVWTKEGIIKVKAMWETATVAQIAAAVGTTDKEVEKIVVILSHNKVALPKKDKMGESTKTVRDMIAQGLL